MPVDRLRPRYSLRSLACLPRYRAQQLPLPPREARRRQVRRAARLRGAGVRRFQGPVRVPAGQGRARDGCLGEGDPQDHARGRVGRPCSRTAALQLVRGRGHARAGQPRQPGFHRRTTQREVAHGHHRDQGQRRKGVPFADDRLPRRHGRGAHGRDVAERRTGATRCRVRPAATLRPGERPVAHSDRGCHYRWPGWLERMGRHGLVRSMSAKGCSPDNAAAEGFFGRMKVESVHLRALGGTYVRGGHQPRRRIHPLVQPFEDQTVAGLEKPGRIQNKPGAGRIGNNSKKTSAAPYHEFLK